MVNKHNIIKFGEVEDIDDEYDGLRVKVKLSQDGDKKEPPSCWAFPLLPKVFQCVPKIGECVLVILANSDNKNSDRFYIGPVISQPQYQDMCSHNNDTGPATSLFQKGIGYHILPRLSNYGEMTDGSFPEKGSVSMVGREGQDITMKPSYGANAEELTLRCGIRGYSDTTTGNEELDKGLKGRVIFNDIDPAYIQLKYGWGLSSGSDKKGKSKFANSMVNIAADKINLIGISDDTIDVNRTDRNTLIKTEDLSKLMDNLHQVPLGDKLVDFLNLFVAAFMTHEHHPHYSPPIVCGKVEELYEAQNKINDILSEYVRIS